MTQSRACRCLSLALLAIAFADSALAAQTIFPRQPPTSSRRIEGRDGDVVVLKGDDRLTVLRRREGNVRVVFDAARHWLLLLADYGSPSDAAPDGIVDWVYSFRDVSGEWPLGARWEGTSTVDEYSLDGGIRATTITTPAGVVALASPIPNLLTFPESPAVMLTYKGTGRGTSGRLSFDDAEQRQIADLIAHAGDAGTRFQSGSGVSAETRLTGDAAGASPGRPPLGPSTSRQPVKLFDVKPVYPQKARDARITGNVVLEITVGIDGAVTDARVIRSIPLLDEAALQAVRQWRYDVTMRDGVPVPVTLIVNVPFGM